MGYGACKEIQLENGTTVKVNKNSFPISPEKFRRICYDRHILFSDISREIGYASNSISSALSAGYMNNVMIKGLQNVFGIKYEEYAYIPEKPEGKPAEQPEENPEQPAQPVQQSMITETLYETVKQAVMDAINEAIAGNMKNLRGCFYTAVYSAINAAKKEAAQ